ncbi:hypothetical protein TIFTF001_037468 [Ficus carica]|uniref:Uncharacterized protein n=1 Tax=Ficus carica TaxID=3494 RepID=A0AA88E8S7_FICCA|nr:hypothetical protein TIFTF001_037468 [Ficus carica]
MIGLAQSLYAMLPIKRKQREVMGTPAFPAGSGVWVTLSGRVDMPQVHRHPGADDMTSAIAGCVKRRMQGAMSRYYCQLVWGNMTRAIRDPQSRWCSIVVWEMPSGPITRAPTLLHQGPHVLAQPDNGEK